MPTATAAAELPEHGGSCEGDAQRSHEAFSTLRCNATLKMRHCTRERESIELRAPRACCVRGRCCVQQEDRIRLPLRGGAHQSWPSTHYQQRPHHHHNHFELLRAALQLAASGISDCVPPNYQLYIHSVSPAASVLHRAATIGGEQPYDLALGRVSPWIGGHTGLVVRLLHIDG